jgi:hypothetical protein
MTGQGEAIQPLDASAEAAAPVPEAAAAPPIDVKFDRADRNSFALTGAIAFAGYLITLAPNLTLTWSGLYSTAAYYGGTNAPPGYPVWTLYAWLFAHLIPFSNIAWRIALSSALASAAACGLVAFMISYSGRIMLGSLGEFSRLSTQQQNRLRVGCGCVVGLILAFSGTVWGNAVIVDVGGLGLLLFTGVLCLLMRWFFEPTRNRFLSGAFLLYGMLLTNNQELFVMLPALMVAAVLGNLKVGRDLCLFVLPVTLLATCFNGFSVWLTFFNLINWIMAVPCILIFSLGITLAGITRGVATEWMSVLLCCAGLLAGLAFYLYLPVASMTTPPVNWGYARTSEGFFHLIGRGQYERVHPTSSLPFYIQQLWTLVDITGKEFGWLYMIVAIVPVAFARRLSLTVRRWLLALAALYAGVGLLLLAQLNPSLDLQVVRLISDYFSPSFVVVAILAGLGLIVIGIRMVRPAWTSSPASV